MATSCATTGFKQSAAVDLELRFYRWDSMCITKPDTRENGFLTLLEASQIPQEIERLGVSRNLAAIVVGYSYDNQQVLGIANQWHQRLSALGFQRVVVLRGTDALPIAGLPIVFDSAMSSGNDTRSLANPYAAAPPAPRADASYSSVAAIR